MFCINFCCCRLILFLQQSSVEWASSLWLKEIQELDPQFQRTVRPGRGTAALHRRQRPIANFRHVVSVVMLRLL